MRGKEAFTLVEILIVVVLLGILAAIVLPGFSNVSETSRASMVAENLRVLRSQFELFKGQHVGVPPGCPDGDTGAAPTEAALVAQMTKSSKATGQTADAGTAGYPYGPYFGKCRTTRSTASAPSR